MTFDQIWAQLIRKHPKLERPDAKVEFTVGNLRRLLRQVYEKGEASVQRKSPTGDPLDQLYDIFGGK